MKIIFIEKTIKNNALLKSSFYTLDLENEKFIEIYESNFFFERLKTIKDSYSKKLDKLLKEEDYSLTENLKKYAIFENAVNNYIESLEEENLLKIEKKINNFRSILIDEHRLLSSLEPEKIYELIYKVLTTKKNLIVEIENYLDKKEKNVKIREIEEKEEKKKKD